MSKLCKRCKAEKDESEFTPGELKKSNGWCAICKREYSRNYYVKKYGDKSVICKKCGASKRPVSMRGDICKLCTIEELNGCQNCNYAKNKMNVKEFLEWVERVYKHQVKCGSIV